MTLRLTFSPHSFIQSCQISIVLYLYFSQTAVKYMQLKNGLAQDLILSESNEVRFIFQGIVKNSNSLVFTVMLQFDPNKIYFVKPQANFHDFSNKKT